MQMVLVLGATSKVSEQLQIAQQVVSKSVQNSRTVPTSGNSARSPTSTPVGCARRHHLCVGRICSESCRVNFIVIAGDFWCASVLVVKGNACHANILGGPVPWYGCGTGTGRPRHITKVKNGLTRRARPHGPQVSGEWVGTC